LSRTDCRGWPFQSGLTPNCFTELMRPFSSLPNAPNGSVGSTLYNESCKTSERVTGIETDLERFAPCRLERGLLSRGERVVPGTRHRGVGRVKAVTSWG
jgi:hypothetical protein